MGESPGDWSLHPLHQALPVRAKDTRRRRFRLPAPALTEWMLSNPGRGQTVMLNAENLLKHF